jgi:alanine dehydrogenase
MSIQVAAMLQQAYYGGSGMLLGGVPGVPPAQVVIIGGGIVGSNAAKIAVGMGANVTILDINQSTMAAIDRQFNGRVNTVFSNPYSLNEWTAKADVLIGAVLVPGAKAPKTVTEEMVKNMKDGSVIVDVAIDQGGTVETIDRITYHDSPAYEKHGVMHYSVANMSGAVPHTSTWALTGVTLPYLIEIANKGTENALKQSEALRLGLNTYKGHITYKAVAEAMGKDFKPAEELL